MADKTDQQPSVGEIVDFVKAYAQQETIGPLKGAGRWVAWGAAASLTLSIGLWLVTLGLLRLVQTEWKPSQGWSWVPYLVPLVVCGVSLVLAIRSIDKTYLNKES